MFCYTGFGMAGWALERNHSELTCDKEPNIGFIGSNPEINVDMMDFTDLFKMH